MVEMRYVWCDETIHQVSQGMALTKKVKVLQYRQKLVMGAWGTIPPLDAPTGWSEWIDVPTVEEVK